MSYFPPLIVLSLYLAGFFLPPILYADNSGGHDVKSTIAKAISILHIARPSYADINVRLVNADNQEKIKLALADFFLKDLHDPFSSYIPADQQKAKMSGSNDAPFGLGIELLNDGHQLLVIPYKDGPTYAAGFSDYSYTIVSLNGVPVTKSKDIGDILSKAPQQPLLVSFRSTSNDQVTTSTITPGRYSMSSVEQRISAEHTIIRIRTFKKEITVKELTIAVTDIEHIAHHKDAPLVLDLRGCDGGDLHEAINAVALFLKPKAKILTSIDGLETATVYLSPKKNTPITRRPLLLLVDEFTASAAEVFVAALSYNGAATTAGSTTCGKCTSQTTLPFKDGSVLKVTDFKLQYPSGDYCAGRGILPDMPLLNTGNDDEAIRLGTESLMRKKNKKRSSIAFGPGHCETISTGEL